VRRHSCFKALSSGLEEVLDDLGALDVSVLPHQALREESQVGGPSTVGICKPGQHVFTQGVGRGRPWWRGAVVFDAPLKHGSPLNTCISCAIFNLRMMLAGGKAWLRPANDAKAAFQLPLLPGPWVERFARIERGIFLPAMF
jgi:hypothetical protein